MNISKGLNNLFKPTFINFIIALCIVIIIILVYIKTNTFDLFNSGVPTSMNNDLFATFINKYLNNIRQENNYMKTLATREQIINNLSNQVSNLINPST